MFGPMYVCLRSSNLSQLSQRPRSITEVSYNSPFPLKCFDLYIQFFFLRLCIWGHFNIFTYVCMWKYTLYNFIRIPFEFCFFKIYQFFQQTIPFSSSLIIDSFFITNCCTHHRDTRTHRWPYGPCSLANNFCVWGWVVKRI